MSDSAAPDKHSVRLAEVFDVERIQVSVEATSAKRLLEKLSYLLTKGHQYEIEKNTIFQVLMERERLGSTCIGKGVALPHGRLHDLPCAVGAVVRLLQPIEFGGHDDEKVSIACGLLVPGNCADVHLQLVSRLARGFDTGDMYSEMMEAHDAEDLFVKLIGHDK